MAVQANAPILVVGATGNVGGHLTRLLAERGRDVRAATRTPNDYEAARHGADAAHVEAVRFDYTDPATYQPALDGAGGLFLMAPSDPEAAPQVGALIEAAASLGVEHAALMTAMGVEHAPDDAPLRRAERRLEEASPAHTLLRPNWFMQNFTGPWLPMIQDAGVLRLPAGDAATSFVDAEDIAAVAAAALTEDGHAGQAYTITGGEALTYDEAADVLSEAAGRTITYEAVSDDVARDLMVENGFAPEYAGMLVGLFENVRAGGAASVSPDVEDVTGRAPTTLRAYAEEHAGAWQ